MQFIGILMGLLMLVSVFFKWQVVSGGPERVSHFLGLQHNAFFGFLGHRANALPIVLALVLIVAMALAKSKPWKFVAFLASLFALGVAVRDIRHLMPLENVKAGVGLWIFAAASALAVIAAILILLKKKAPKSSPAATPVP